MSLIHGLLGSALGSALICTLVSRSARARGIRRASISSCLQSMLLGLSLGELIWLPFSIQAAPAGAMHPMSFVFIDQSLAQLPMVGIMGCVAVIGTVYWGCTAVTLGLLSYKRWGIALHHATRVYLPWTSLWTLAHLVVFYLQATEI